MRGIAEDGKSWVDEGCDKDSIGFSVKVVRRL